MWQPVLLDGNSHALCTVISEVQKDEGCLGALQAALKGFKKVLCFESSPLNYEATKAAIKEQKVKPSGLSAIISIKSPIHTTKASAVLAMLSDTAQRLPCLLDWHCSHAIRTRFGMRSYADVHALTHCCKLQVCRAPCGLARWQPACLHRLTWLCLCQVPDKAIQLVNMAVLNVTGAEVEILLGDGTEGTSPASHLYLMRCLALWFLFKFSITRYATCMNSLTVICL